MGTRGGSQEVRSRGHLGGPREEIKRHLQSPNQIRAKMGSFHISASTILILKQMDLYELRHESPQVLRVEGKRIFDHPKENTRKRMAADLPSVHETSARKKTTTNIMFYFYRKLFLCHV